MSNLRVSEPFSLDDFETMFRSMFRPVRYEMAAPTPSIKLEVSENDEAFSVKAEIPGVKKEDINVQIEGNTVSISAESKQQKEEKDKDKLLRSEFSYGVASRSFSLGAAVDPDRVKAKYEDGILALTLPKRPSAKGSRVAIQ